MQPYIFPYIGYFQLIGAVDRFVVYDDVNYINKGWINRNSILINGKPGLFTLPLKEASQNKKINEIHVSDDRKWIAKILRTIEMNYGKAPYFKKVFPLVSNILEGQSSSIANYNYQALAAVCEYLKIQTEIVPSSAIYGNEGLKGQDRILDICLRNKTTDYINPIGGMELYTKDTFLQNEIRLNFIKSKDCKYKQFENEFVPWLSIVDVLMFNSVDEINYMLSQYELI